MTLKTIGPVLALGLLVLLLLPGTAAAHGIGEDATGRSVAEFIPLGIEHMLLGWDHLLFIFGVVLLAGSVRTAAKLISLFVLGHSLTLIIATLAGWQLDATLVDVVIAISVAYVGFQGLRGRPTHFATIGAVVFGFGLVHGLGLSTRLQDLGIPEDDLLWRVLAFNVGIELGQLWALTVVFGIGYVIRRFVPEPGRLVRPAFMALLGAGLIAAAVLSFPSDEQLSDSEVVAEKAGCVERTSSPPEASADAGHPGKRFYSPGDEVPVDDLNHVVGDGYVIVRYDNQLAPRDLIVLERWMSGAGALVVAAPAADLEQTIEARTARRIMGCDRLDTAALTAFNEEWFEELSELQSSEAS